MSANRELRFDVCPLCGAELGESGVLTDHLSECANSDFDR